MTRPGQTFSGKSALVTGGAGFIGSHVVDALVGAGARVTVVDNLSTGFVEFLNSSARFVRGDLLDQRLCDELLSGQDYVFHFAANADVRDGLSHPRKDVEQNVTATHNLLEAMRKNGVRRIAFASTGALYGDARVLPTPEDAPFPVQTSLYGASKVAAEGLLTAYAFGYGFQVWIFRFVSMLGPRYTHGHVFDFWKKLKSDPTRLEVLGDGRQKKSYLHVLDCVAAILLAVERAGEPINIFNIGHTDWLEVTESVRIICSELGLNPRLEFSGGERGWVGDAPKILLDTQRLRALGWQPAKGLEQAVRETLRFLIDNPYCDRRG
jgi:UDP-glucose 4-epimerase